MGLKRATAFATPATPWLHGFLGWAFWLESRLFPKGVYGTSLVCVCRPETHEG
jgi:hypothetical protein